MKVFNALNGQKKETGNIFKNIPFNWFIFVYFMQ